MSASPSGRSLEQALESGPLGPAAGVALADDLFGALASLHAAGGVHGEVGPGLVRLRSDGRAELSAGTALGTDRGADLRAAAALVCAALGIAPEWRPADPLRENERSAPALAATLRAVAQGSLPLDAAGARAALREAAGGLADGDAQAAGRAELARRSGAAQPAAAPVPAAVPAVSVAAARAPRSRRLWIALGVAAALVLLAALGALGWSSAGHQRTPTAGVPSASPSSLGVPSPSPLPLPSQPAATGPITSVVETPQSTCRAGSTCRIEVDVHFQQSATPLDVSWQFQLVDSCTSAATFVKGSTVHALKGWVHVVGDSEVTLPAGHPLAVIAITTQPSHAASAPLLVTGGTC